MKLKANPGDRVTLGISIKETRCTCGSGKEASLCCNEPATRHHELQISAATINSSDGLAISSSGEVMRIVKGKMKPLTGIRRLRVANKRHGRRDKLTAATVAEAGQELNPDIQLFRFPHILVVDTNSKYEPNKKRFATAIFQVDPRSRSGETASLGYKPALVIEFKEPAIPPERIGWLFAIEVIKNSEHLTGKRIAIVTDHDASRHDALNCRTEKIDGRLKLPKNMRLIYASSDRGSHALNKLMRLADRMASMALRTEEWANSSPWEDGSTFQCETFRLAYPDPKGGDWAISETASIKYSHHPEGF